MNIIVGVTANLFISYFHHAKFQIPFKINIHKAPCIKNIEVTWLVILVINHPISVYLLILMFCMISGSTYIFNPPRARPKLAESSGAVMSIIINR